MGFAGGEALVEQMVGEGGVGLEEGGGKGLRFDRLWAGTAVGVERFADDEGGDLVLADPAGDGLEVGAQGRAVDGEERLCGEAERVGDGEADAAIADVEGEDAAGRHSPSVGERL